MILYDSMSLMKFVGVVTIFALFTSTLGQGDESIFSEEECFKFGCFSLPRNTLNEICKDNGCSDMLKGFSDKVNSMSDPDYNSCLDNECWEANTLNNLLTVPYDCVVAGCYSKKAVEENKFPERQKVLNDMMFEAKRQRVLEKRKKARGRY